MSERSMVRPLTALAALAWAATLGAVAPTWAQTVPHSLVASPEIYKVIAENAQYRVIEVVWKPGQRDAAHSHPASAVYYLTDCRLQAFDATGVPFTAADRKAGTAVVQAPIAAHSIQNAGSDDCRLIMFEPK